MKLREINPHNKNYPSYIYKIKDINVLESKKRAFRKAAESFEINKFDKLCYRLVDKEEVNDSFESNEDNKINIDKEKEIDKLSEKINKISLNKKRKKFLKEEKYTLYEIPYKINEYNLIKDIHIELNHRSSEYVRKEIKKRHIYYKGIVNDIKYVISRCMICAQKNNS